MSIRPWTDIDALARLAPTPHNTQPFRIRPLDGRTAQIVILPERMLPVEDGGNRYVLASFGIFAETLELAGRHFGLLIRVTAEESVRPEAVARGNGPVLLGHVEVIGGCQPEDQETLLDARRTSRLPYEDRRVAAAAVAEFGRIAAGSGHRFESFDDPVTVRAVLEQNVAALLGNNLKPAELAELRGWIRFGPTPPAGDGLWRGVMNQPGWEMRLALRLPRLFLLPGIMQLARRKYLRTQAGTPHVAVVRGPFHSWPELVVAGRVMMRVWLAMTRRGVYMMPLGSMVTHEESCRWLRTRFAAADIWWPLRFGYSPVPPRAPRLASVLC